MTRDVDERRMAHEDRREERRGDITRAEIWRLVDDSNKQWRDAHQRQTDVIDRLGASLSDMVSRFERKIADHEKEDRAIALAVHDLLERERGRTKRVAAFAGLVAMVVGPGAAVLFKKWFGV